jgi:Glycosyl transferase family 2
MSAVDVVVPCYNYGRFLERCVHSILSQEQVDVRVLIIDDASSDDTPDAGESLVMRDRRVEYRRHCVNYGHIATYNEGLLGWAAAEYALLLSADDMLAPSALARATQIMDRHAEVGMTYGMALYIWDDEDPSTLSENALQEYQIIPGARFLQRCFEHGNTVSTPTAVVRTAVQREIGGYSADLPHAADMEMWMRYGVQGPIGVLRGVQAYYRWHGSNMSYPFRAEQLRDKREVEEVCARIAEHCGSEFPECSAWLDAMYRRTAEEAFWLASTAFDLGDMEAYRVNLEYAAARYPGLRRSSMWWRLRAKMLLGAALWTKVWPLLDRLRGLPERPHALWTPPRRGHQYGWWPESAS